MRKLFSLFVALLATTCLWAYDFQSGDLYYNITSSSEPFAVEVTNNGTDTLTSVVIPSTVEYNGITYAVTSIGQYAFYACTSLTSISIPNSVTTIGNLAFAGCSSLTSITIPKSVTDMGKLQNGGTYRGPVFTYCPALTSIVVEEGNPIYDSRDNCNAIVETATNTIICGCKNTTFPQSVTGIGTYAFNGCSSLTSITIPNHITNIQSNPFRSCSSLATIVIESNNSIYDSRDNCNAIIETATNTLIAGCQNTIIPNSVTGIGDEAFYGCSSLTSINIPENITSIGGSAFRSCSSLTSINIPENVTSIGYGAFYDCSSLISINIPEGVTSIEPSTYTGCSALTSINIPESVTSIGDYAFQDCDSLTSITIPKNVTSIGKQVFSSSLDTIYCYIVTPIQISASTFSNYRKAILFVPCESLDAYFADKVWKRFDNIQCLGDEIPQEGNSIYYTSSDGNIVTPNAYFSATDVFGANIISNTYENGQGIITFDAPITSIGESAFSNCSSLTTIIIPNSVANIGSTAFANCSSLTSITIPNSVTKIGSYAFNNTGIYNDETNWENEVLYIDNCLIQARSSIAGENIIKENTRLIADFAFYNCPLTSITIPKSVTNIGYSAFPNYSLVSIVVDIANATYDSRDNCNAIVETETNTLIVGCPNTIIVNSITHIGEWAFGGCTSLTSMTIPNSIISIEAYAFYACESINSIIIPESVTSIAKNTFEGCTFVDSNFVNKSSLNAEMNNYWGAIIVDKEIDGLLIRNDTVIACRPYVVSAIIPNGVKSIGERAFAGRSAIISVTIPNSVTSIGERAFALCTFTSITIPNSVTNIEGHAFNNCHSLTSITIPNSVTSIENGTFFRCLSLASITIPNSVTNIGEMAFFVCSSLTSITIPNSVTSIGFQAFEGCASLTSVTIGNNVTNIGAYAFTDCASLDTINCYADVPPIVEVGAFEDWSGATRYGADLFIPCESLEAYKAHEVWGRFSNIQCIEEDEEEEKTKSYIYYTSSDGNIVNPTNANGFGANIISNTYENGQGIITFDGAVTNIGDNAFLNCSSLTSITIPNSITSIGVHAFDDCESLISINIPNSITSIGEMAFAWCSSLTSIEIPNSLISIENGTFVNCSSLTSITIPNSVTNIGESAFRYCSSLTSITIPENVTSIGKQAFAESSSLDTIYCYIKTPLEITADIFSQYNATLYVPCESLEVYKAHEVWGQFENIKCIEDVETDAENIHTQSPMTNCQKIIQDNQLLILRDDKTYNIVGQIVE